MGNPTFRTLANVAHAEGIGVGPDGKIWAGGEKGEIYCIDPESGSSSQVAATNSWVLGLCLDAAGRIYACAVELPATVPDGLALEEEGGLTVCCFQPNRILRVPPGGGEPEILLDDWTGQRLLTPTNVAFFGPDRRSRARAAVEVSADP